MRSFARINHYYNNLQARSDWGTEVLHARLLGLTDALREHDGFDAESATWRVIDKRLRRLRECIGAATGQRFNLDTQQWQRVAERGQS